MKRFRGLLTGLILAAAVALGVVAACAIDDDIVWVTERECGSNCTDLAPGAYACDVDSSCTETEGCVDWDCDEDQDWGEADGGDTGGSDVPPTDAVSDGGRDDVPLDADGDAGGGPDPDLCSTGGGESAADAQVLTLGVSTGALTACPFDSQWFRFDVEAGARFRVDLVREVGEVALRLYAGDEIAAVAGAEMDDSGFYDARAGSTGTFYLRVRAVGETEAMYALTVRLVVPE